jgi:hypothetical protein
MSGAMSTQTVWAALFGFALGSAQSLTVDWIRDRRRHRTQLRLLRAELRRLARFDRKWEYEHGVAPKSDETPIPPLITASFERLQHEIDFWLTDAHDDDNTQQTLIDVSDGARLLQRYDADARAHFDAARNDAAPAESARRLARGIEASKEYDQGLDRFRTMVGSGMIDAERRLRAATLGAQLRGLLQRMPSGTNPPPVPTIERTANER